MNATWFIFISFFNLALDHLNFNKTFVCRSLEHLPVANIHHFLDSSSLSSVSIRIRSVWLTWIALGSNLSQPQLSRPPSQHRSTPRIIPSPSYGSLSVFPSLVFRFSFFPSFSLSVFLSLYLSIFVFVHLSSF